MKEIYLRVKVPDDFDLPVTSVIFEKDNMYFRAEKYVTEIQLPSEEEIIQNEHLITDEYENASKDQKWFMGVGFRLCATWLLNKLKGV
jgi:hypothetical protein